MKTGYTLVIGWSWYIFCGAVVLLFLLPTISMFLPVKESSNSARASSPGLFKHVDDTTMSSPLAASVSDAMKSILVFDKASSPHHA